MIIIKEISEKLNLYYTIQRFLADGRYFDFEFCDDIEDVFEYLECGLEKAKNNSNLNIKGDVYDVLITAKDEKELDEQKNILFKIIEETINDFILTFKDDLPGEPEDSFFFFKYYSNELYGPINDDEPFEANKKYKFLIRKWLDYAIDEGISDIHLSGKVYNFLDDKVFCPSKSVTRIAVDSNYGDYNVAIIYKKYCIEVDEDTEVTLEVNVEEI